MKKKVLVMLVKLSIGIIVFSQINVYSQDKNSTLDQRINIDLSNTTMLFVLNKLAFEYRIPIGLEWATNHRQNLSESMSFEDGNIRWKSKSIIIKPGTLEEILNSLIKQEPEYKWEFNDGAVNIFPVKLRDDFLEKLLNTKVENFSPEKGIDKFKIRDDIIEMPVVKDLLASENVQLLKRDYPNSNYLFPDNEISISISNTDIKGILNKIVRTTIHKIWIIERIGKNKENLLVAF